MDWMMIILTAVYAAASIALVIITLRSVNVSKEASDKTLKHLGEVEIEKQRPIVIITEYFEQTETGTPASKWVLRNVGSGPGLKCEFEDKGITGLGGALHLREALKSKLPFAIGAGDNFRFFPDSKSINEPDSIKYKDWNCEIKYKDIYGNGFVTAYDNGRVEIHKER